MSTSMNLCINIVDEERRKQRIGATNQKIFLTSNTCFMIGREEEVSNSCQLPYGTSRSNFFVHSQKMNKI